jgi:hypothetical protein
VTASLFSIRAVEAVAADRRRDLLAQAEAHSARRLSGHARRRWFTTSRGEGSGHGSGPLRTGAPWVRGAGEVVGVARAGEQADVDLSPPAAAAVVDLRPLRERPVPSTRW